MRRSRHARNVLMQDLRSEEVQQWFDPYQNGSVPRSHEPRGVYWLYPFRAYHTFCPYLVGTHAEVGAMLKRYIALGASTLILDEPVEQADLEHTVTALNHAYAPAG